MASGLLYGHQSLLSSMLVLLPTFTLGSKQLLPDKKVNFYHWTLNQGSLSLSLSEGDHSVLTLVMFERVVTV